jgi:hypothetical protein
MNVSAMGSLNEPGRVKSREWIAWDPGYRFVVGVGSHGTGVPGSRYEGEDGEEDVDCLARGGTCNG